MSRASSRILRPFARPWRGAIAALALGLAACAAPTPRETPDAAPPLSGDMQRLMTMAEDYGSVRIIARTSAGPQPVAGAAHPALRMLHAAGAADARMIVDGLDLIVADVTPAQLQALAGSGLVRTVAEDALAFTNLAETIPIVEAEAAWRRGSRGAGQGIAILDTGIDGAHPFLSGHVVAEACFSTTSPAAGAETLCPSGAPFQEGAGAAAPCALAGCDHGTHVAGIAAGSARGLSGVAPDAQLIAIAVFSRFTDRPGGPRPCAASGQASPCIAAFTSDQIRALDYVRSLTTERVIAAASMSLGGGRAAEACDGDLIADVIGRLRDLNVATVIAAGNDGFSGEVSRPGCVSAAITVGAATDDDRLAPFSNRGPQVDILAPGVAVNSSVPGGGFAQFSGTSMATPHVAGAIAVLHALYPSATLDQIETALKETGRAIGGRPRLRVDAAAERLGALVRAAAAPVAPGVAEAAAVAAPPAPPKALAAVINRLPEGAPARMLVRARSAQIQDVEAVAAAARGAGAARVETVPGQAFVIVEAHKDPLRALAADAAVAGMELDALARPN